MKLRRCGVAIKYFLETIPGAPRSAKAAGASSFNVSPFVPVRFVLEKCLFMFIL